MLSRDDEHEKKDDACHNLQRSLELHGTKDHSVYAIFPDEARNHEHQKGLTGIHDR